MARQQIVDECGRPSEVDAVHPNFRADGSDRDVRAAVRRQRCRRGRTRRRSDGTSARRVRRQEESAPINIAARRREYATKNIRMCAFSHTPIAALGKCDSSAEAERVLVVEVELSP